MLMEFRLERFGPPFSRWLAWTGCLLLFLATAFNVDSHPVLAQTDQRKYLEDPFGSDHAWFLAQAVDAANRKLSHELSGESWKQAVVDACDLYIQLQLDPVVAQSPTLQGKQRKLRAILKRCQSKLEREPSPWSATPEKTGSTAADNAVSVDPLGRPLSPKIETTGDSAGENSAEISLAAWEAESNHWKMVYQMAPGPGQILSRSGGAVVGDGANLVRLIQTTVTPHTWDVNGGPSTILYYQRVHSLVVRAPWMTHQETERRLGQLRN